MASQIHIPCEELRRLYLEEGLGVAQIGAALGRSASTISIWLRRCAIATRSGRFRRADVPREPLERLYLGEALPLREIASRLGVSVGTVSNRLRAYGIPRRRRTAASVGPAASAAGQSLAH
jgi:DNA-directed RNA polymerase specialized sigma24 family protein